MAGRLRRLYLLIGIVVMALQVPLVSAQTSSDPTRPAVDETAATSGSGGAAGQESVGLQTIIRRKGAKPAAIISGVYVEQGGRVGESRLLTVGDDFVVLTGPAGKETLTLTPGIQKQSLKPATQKSSGKLIRKSHKSARTE